MNTISQEVVEKRKQAAPKLKEIIDRAKKCSNALGKVEGAAALIDAPKHQLLEDISASKLRLGSLVERTELRHSRFSSGLVTVAVGGIEKSGKTTLLKTLTGIQDLPTANERCTAVCCEIIYDTSRSDFDLEFHSDEAFCEAVLQPLSQRFNKCLEENRGEEKITSPLRNLAEFERVILPSLGRFDPGTNPYLQLSDLISLQTHIRDLRNHVGQPPKNRLPLADLRNWVADVEDPAAKARIATVSRCSIHTRFEGGSENLRWVDTPGVDDPSPLARERTLRTIGRDADLLIVATMPRDKPTPTDSFVNFWTSIRNQRDEIGLMDRLLILLNWKVDADPQQVELTKHRAELENKNKVPAHLFCGPIEAIKQGDVEGFMDDVNRHLAANLAGQDSRVVSQLENELKSTLAEVRTTVFDKALRISPSDPSSGGLETSLFLDWFKHTSPSGDEKGFWPQLRGLFVEAVDAIPKSEPVGKAQADLEALFNNQVTKIRTELPTAERMSEMRKSGGGVPPITAYMQHFSMSSFSDLVNALARQVQEFGPIMQQAILDVLKQSGLAPMITEQTTNEALMELIGKLDQERWKAGEDNPVLNALSELAGLKQTLHYVYRWEMRPAINFLSPLHWGQGRAIEEMAGLFELAGQKENAENLRQYFKANLIPGVQDDDPKHAAVFQEICKFALKGIQAVLSGSRCRLQNIADDFVRDFQTRLTFGSATEGYWRDLLAQGPRRAELLGAEIESIRANSEKIQKFRFAVIELGESLD